jgi:hypothetical protein
VVAIEQAVEREVLVQIGPMQPKRGSFSKIETKFFFDGLPIRSRPSGVALFGAGQFPPIIQVLQRVAQLAQNNFGIANQSVQVPPQLPGGSYFLQRSRSSGNVFSSSPFSLSGNLLAGAGAQTTGKAQLRALEKARRTAASTSVSVQSGCRARSPAAFIFRADQ